MAGFLHFVVERLRVKGAARMPVPFAVSQIPCRCAVLIGDGWISFGGLLTLGCLRPASLALVGRVVWDGFCWQRFCSICSIPILCNGLKLSSLALEA